MKKQLKQKLSNIYAFLRFGFDRRKNTMPFYGTGFTIIEMVVAVGVFTVIITASLTSLLNVSDIQRRAEALRVANDNLNFSLETMAREIRAGHDYGMGGASLTFTSGYAGGEAITYSLNNATHRIEKTVNAGPSIALTAPEINISRLVFEVTGATTNDGFQPRVTIVINGSAGEKTKINFNLQTTVSQRQLDS